MLPLLRRSLNTLSTPTATLVGRLGVGVGKSSQVTTGFGKLAATLSASSSSTATGGLKMATAEEAVNVVESGMNVFIQGAMHTPHQLIGALAKRASPELKDVTTVRR